MTFNNLSHLHSTDLPQPQASPSQQLERLWNLPSTNRNQRISARQRGYCFIKHRFIKQVGQQLVAFLTADQSVRIWTSYSKDGVVWHAYDPIRDRRSSHTSEDDLRAWLEQRHLS